MRSFARFALRTVGVGEEIRHLGPLITINFIGSVGFSAFWAYVGVWAVKELGARPGEVGVMFVFDALAAAATGLWGGHLSDRLGRKPLVVFGLAVQGLLILPFGWLGHRVFLGLALVVVVAAVGSPAITIRNTMVADLVAEEHREQAYAAMRVVNNLSLVLGPPLAGLLLLGDDWKILFVAIAALGIFSGVLSIWLLPAVRAQEEGEEGPTAVGRGIFGVMIRDGAFVLLLASNLLGFVVYIAYDSVLPVVAVSSYHISPSTWGLLAAVNPVLVALCQVRLTKLVSDVPAAAKLVTAMVLMGPSFLLLLIDAHVATIMVVLVLFVIGEMLWQPTTQALAARAAPQRARGAYLGAFSGSMSVAWTIGPLVSLQLLQAGGATPVWLFFAAASLLGTLAGLAACRAIDRHRRVPEPSHAT